MLRKQYLADDDSLSTTLNFSEERLKSAKHAADEKIYLVESVLWLAKTEEIINKKWDEESGRFQNEKEIAKFFLTCSSIISFSRNLRIKEIIT